MTKVLGAFVEVLGTITAAVGDTPALMIEKQQAESLELIGNILQGIGSALAADDETDLFLKNAGIISSSGNLINVYTYLMDLPEEKQSLLFAKGDLTQATGSGMALTNSIQEDSQMVIFSDFLQWIGNSLEAIASISEFKGKDNYKFLGTIGSWSQAIGAFLALLILLKEKDPLQRSHDVFKRF